jgi:SAM-dependent methyltransferase
MQHTHTHFEDAKFVKFFTSLRAPIAQAAATKIVELASIKDGQTVLDLGCGPGLIAKYIASLRKLRELFLVDRSEEMVKLARRNLRGSVVKYTVKVVDLEHDSLIEKFDSKTFDHVLAIDLWHLLEDRSFARLLFDSLLDAKGTFTLALHKELSKSAMERFRQIRQEIREEITMKLRSRYPEFAFEGGSKGPMVHGDEISRFKSELNDTGFVLVGEEEDESLADVNELAKFPAESFEIEVERLMPKIGQKFLHEVVASSIESVLIRSKFTPKPIATEVLLVFQKPA